jgi:GNAT superfamily N-acetyltransferase
MKKSRLYLIFTYPLPTQLTIKEIVSEDLADVQGILRETFIIASEKTYPKEIMEYSRDYYTMKRLMGRLLGPHTIALGAFIDCELTGCAWGTLYEDGVLSVEWAVVRADMVGKGVFSRLLTELEDRGRTKGALKVFLYASIKNAPAVRRYLKLGYSVEGVHRNHFFGWDFVSMGKILAQKHQDGDITMQPDATW